MRDVLKVNGIVLVEEAEIRERWQRYFCKLFNGENVYSLRAKRGVQEGHLNIRECSRISKEEVKEALKKMKSGKTVGPDFIPVEVWKCLGKVGVDWLMKLFNVIFRTVKILSEWGTSTVIPAL